MPKKSPRKCNTIGCPNLTHDSYCESHSKNRHRQYKQDRTDVKEQSFYVSVEWRKLRAYKRGINPLCEQRGQSDTD
ncbi:hypothetical protein AWH48_19350 [Domibacillus aminovorans]|uniref:HNH endonuclease n=1 Tax=Domibacillus aminovorans TaxID=29332 RepID=A0A177KVF4_9BACI|nr:hypothetical protein AWH48_19350 [Domibacillus aminovorans]